MPMPPLTETSVKILELAHDGGVTSREVQALFSISQQGANETLSRLLRLGLVTRTRRGGKRKLGAVPYHYEGRVKFSEIMATRCPRCEQKEECFQFQAKGAALPLKWPHKERVLAAVAAKGTK